MILLCFKIKDLDLYFFQFSNLCTLELWKLFMNVSQMFWILMNSTENWSDFLYTECQHFMNDWVFLIREAGGQIYVLAKVVFFLLITN